MRQIVTQIEWTASMAPQRCDDRERPAVTMEPELREIDPSFNGGVMEERENKESSITRLDIDLNKGNISTSFLAATHAAMLTSVVPRSNQLTAETRSEDTFHPPGVIP